MATLTGTVPFPEWGLKQTVENYLEKGEIALAKLTDVSDNLQEGEIVGKVISFPVADGSALYLVTKEKPLQLKHIPYLDAYQVNPIMIRGLRKQDILDFIEHEKKVAKFFKERKEE